MRQPEKFGNFPNYELLKYVTKRRDAVAIRAWTDLNDLFLSGKDCYLGPPYNRRKRWLRKLKKQVFVILLNEAKDGDCLKKVMK